MNYPPRTAVGSEQRFFFLYATALLLSIGFNLAFVVREQLVPPPVDGVGVLLLENAKILASSSSVATFPPTPTELVHDSFAACLLLMDDNHRLTEWMAYHVHVLPLKYLIVAVDPNSKTSPSRLLQPWRLEYNLTILEWTDKDIFQDSLQEFQQLSSSKQFATRNHRRRQTMFHRQCLLHLKQVGRTWVMLTDIDEYLLFNGPAGSRENYAGLPYPSIHEHGSILHFLNNPRVQSLPQFHQQPCIAIPRMLFGTNESLPEEIHNHVPPALTEIPFETLRYRKHLRRHVTHHHPSNGWGKCIVDVSRVDWSDLPTRRDSWVGWPVSNQTAHLPLPAVCPRPFVKDEDTLLRINHYVGSWQAYSFRQDARQKERSYQTWLDKAKRADQTDDNIRPWLQGFVDQMDETQKNMLMTMLNTVGVFE
jgi:hypothetical protein